MSPEQVAEGFLRIAVENMANAIKKISVQRGYDVTRYTLNCFGGAGGQHACLVADALGMETVFLHPYAGVLSAYGMGLAEVRALRERQFERDAAAAAAAAAVARRARRRRPRRGAEPGNRGGGDPGRAPGPAALRRLAPAARSRVRHEAELRARFDAAHRARYGFSAGERRLIIESLTVEVIGGAGDVADSAAALDSSSPERADSIRMHSEGAWCEVPLFDREAMRPGQAIDGPAVIKEPTATTVVEAGWQAALNAYGHLILTRTVPLERHEAIGTKADPIMLEVFNNLFMSIAEQMGATLANTAYSVNIKERLDFSCALFDRSTARWSPTRRMCRCTSAPWPSRSAP